MLGSTILILGGDDDDHARHVQAHLRSRGHDAEFLDSRCFPSAMTIALEPQSGQGSFRLPGGRSLAFDDVRSVYWRIYHGVGAAPLPDADQAWIAQNDSRSLFESLLMLLPARWVNGWQAYALHQTKPVQLAKAARLGARIPETLLTNDPAELKQFAQAHSAAIVKPVQGGDHARQLTPDQLQAQNLHNLELAPITVQQEIGGTNVRAFVAGEQVLACEIRTQSLDYREDPSSTLLVHRLPRDVEILCLGIARELYLVWTGIDFRRTEQGEYIFLEANPSPMFIGFEKQTGLPLTDCLADLLIG